MSDLLASPDPAVAPGVHLGQDGRLARLAMRMPVSRKSAVVMADALAVAVAGMIAVLVRQRFTGEAARPVDVAFALGTIPVWLAAGAHKKVFTSRYITRRLDEIHRITSATIVTSIVMSSMAFVLELTISRGLLGLHLVTAAGVLVAERTVLRSWYERQRLNGHMRRPVLIAGGNTEARELARMLREERRLGYDVLGLLSDDPVDDQHVPVVGRLEDAAKVATSMGATGVLIATTAVDPTTSNRLTRELVEAGVHVELSSTLLDIDPSRLQVRPLGRYPVVFVEPVARSGWRPTAKRCFDVFAASLGLLVMAPVLAASALAIKLDSKGPVLFKQLRVGREGVPFTVLKLRTMVVDAEERLIDLRERNEADGPLFKISQDPRVTRVGAVLRRSSLDELPQLWNVIRGEMSLVGPRPALPTEMEGWDADLFARTRVQPGLTGLWQVSGRSDADFATYSRLDLYYVDNWSLLNDLGILVRTVPAVLARKGAC